MAEHRSVSFAFVHLDYIHQPPTIQSTDFKVAFIYRKLSPSLLLSLANLCWSSDFWWLKRTTERQSFYLPHGTQWRPQSTIFLFACLFITSIAMVLRFFVYHFVWKLNVRVCVAKNLSSRKQTTEHNKHTHARTHTQLFVRFFNFV